MVVLHELTLRGGKFPTTDSRYVVAGGKSYCNSAGVGSSHDRFQIWCSRWQDLTSWLYVEERSRADSSGRRGQELILRGEERFSVATLPRRTAGPQQPRAANRFRVNIHPAPMKPLVSQLRILTSSWNPSQECVYVLILFLLMLNVSLIRCVCVLYGS